MNHIWIDALDFQEKGGFIADTQFIREMGQGYLLADGVGVPVEPASTVFSIRKPGKYRIFIRTKNWNNEYTPDGLEIAVDGVKSGHICGEMRSQGWYWEIAGDFPLEEGEHRISVRDTKGWFGRFAAVVLTDDLDFVPSPEISKWKKQRWSMLGGRPETESLGRFDFAVVGGGAAGISAAIAAARFGMKAALINDRPVLGGNGSDEAHVSLDGAAHKGDQETGIIFEIKTVKEREALTWSQAFAKVVGAEENLSLFENLSVCDAETENGRITRISMTDAISLRDYTLDAEYFCDATGDAWLGYYADAAYHIGREPGSQYQEKFAPETPDGYTMSGCITRTVTDGGETICSFLAKDIGHAVTFDPPDWAYKLPEGDELGREPRLLNRGEWWLETPNDYDDIWESEYVRDTMFRIAAGYFDWLKNSWRGREKSANYALEKFGYFNAKRESRRLIGDYVMTQNDFGGDADFPDAVCYAGWNIDVHHVNGIFSGRGGSFSLNAAIPITPIPYRCLYSRNVGNLFMAGRCASLSHVALGACRVQLTCATEGQAVGTAAYLCKKYGITPRETGSAHIEELQQLLLRDGQYIPGVFHHDDGDLARKAEITADSETENGRAANVVNGKTRPRDGEDYAWISSEKLPQSIRLRFKEPQTIGQIRLTFDIPFDRFTYGYLPQPERDETVTDFTVSLKTDKGCEKIAEIRDNYQRLVCINAGQRTAEEIVVTVLKCRRSEFARITEIRVYGSSTEQSRENL